MLKRPVVLMLGVYRGGNRYELHFEQLFDPRWDRSFSRAACIEQAVRLRGPARALLSPGPTTGSTS
jgi:predicted LPLAT superfamily acyltransferase